MIVLVDTDAGITGIGQGGDAGHRAQRHLERHWQERLRHRDDHGVMEGAQSLSAVQLQKCLLLCSHATAASATGSSSRVIDGSAGTGPCRSPYIQEMLNVTISI